MTPYLIDSPTFSQFTEALHNSLGSFFAHRSPKIAGHKHTSLLINQANEMQLMGMNGLQPNFELSICNIF